MSKKTTIYVPDKIESIVSSFGDNGLSGSIATLIERYDRITRDNIPTMTENEWMAFVDIHNGCGTFIAAGGHDQAPSAWANVADSVPDGMDEKWEISCKDLAAKIQAMPLVARIAVWDVAARFWASPKLNELPMAELLRGCGAKIG